MHAVRDEKLVEGHNVAQGEGNQDFCVYYKAERDWKTSVKDQVGMEIKKRKVKVYAKGRELKDRDKQKES